MKTLLLTLILAVGVTAQTYWEPAAFNDRQVIEIYGAEHYDGDLITVWFRTNSLRRGVWKRDFKAQVMVTCGSMIIGPLRANRANTGYTRPLPTDYATQQVSQMARGTLGYRASVAACEKVFGY